MFLGKSYGCGSKNQRIVLLDVRDTYMQIGVVDDCIMYKIVQFEGICYELRRPSFGLNCVPGLESSHV